MTIAALKLPFKYSDNKSTSGSREEWLQRAVAGLIPIFKQAGLTLPPVRVSFSLLRKTRAGECHPDTNSKDKRHEILIKLDQSNPATVLGIVAHEMIHAAVGCKAGHKGAFVAGMKALGMDGKPTETGGGAVFDPKVQGLLKTLGPIPHAPLLVRGKKQGTRMLKCECEICGYTVRTTAKWLEFGAPICPVDNLPMKTEGGEDEDGE